VVTRNDAGRTALRNWIRQFCDTYAGARDGDPDPQPGGASREESGGDGLQLLFRLAEAITQGMTAAAREAAARATGPGELPEQRTHRSGPA